MKSPWKTRLEAWPWIDDDIRVKKLPAKFLLSLRVRFDMSIVLKHLFKSKVQVLIVFKDLILFIEFIIA